MSRNSLNQIEEVDELSLENLEAASSPELSLTMPAVDVGELQKQSVERNGKGEPKVNGNRSAAKAVAVNIVFEEEINLADLTTPSTAKTASQQKPSETYTDLLDQNVKQITPAGKDDFVAVRRLEGDVDELTVWSTAV